MIKNLIIILLSLFWCSFSYANLTLYCKQEIRILGDGDGEGLRQITMEQDWEIVITDYEIKVPRWPSLYYDLIRNNEDENEYSGSTGVKLMENAGGVAYHNMIFIDRTTGEGYASTIIFNKFEKNPFVCSDKKKEKKNLF